MRYSKMTKIRFRTPLEMGACILFLLIFILGTSPAYCSTDVFVAKKIDVPGVGPLQGNIPQSEKDREAELKTQDEKNAYSVGVSLAGNLKQQGADIDFDLVLRGMKDAFSGKPLLLNEAEMRKALKIYHTEVRQKQARARTLAAELNGKQGEVFLAENRKKEGVVTLPSGLQYRIITSGGGKRPVDADTIESRYKGMLIDGSVFESSDDLGRPAAMKVAGAMPGLREALKLMPVGSKWQIFLPPKLAYGVHGHGVSVGPNAALIFELELLAIK